MLLVVSLSLDLPSPTVQPDGHANSAVPSALAKLGPDLPVLVLSLPRSLGSSRSSASRTLPAIGRPSASRIGRLADARSSPATWTDVASFDSATLPLRWPGPILAS